MLKIMYTSKPRAKLTRKRLAPSLIGLVAFLLYILWFNVDLAEIISTAKHANLGIFSAAIVVSIGEVFFKAVSWRAILSNLEVEISVMHSFLYTLYGTFIDTIVPTQGISGDFFRTFLVNQEQDGTSGKAVASVVMQRIIVMGIDVVTLVSGVAFLFNTTQLTPLIFNVILLFTISVASVMAVLLLVSWEERWSVKLINGIVRIGEFLSRARWRQELAKIEEATLSVEKMFHDSMIEFGHSPAGLIVPAVLLFLKWASSFVVPYLVFLSLGLPVSWTVIFVTSSVVAAVKAIPVGIPFEIGLPEITMTTFYTLMGVPTEIGITATILSRILTLWLRFAISFIAQQYVELKY